MSSNSFLTSDMTSKNDIFMYILMCCYQKSGCGDILLTPPFPLGFAAITDHPRAG
jgi:hypothetical protein